MYQDILRRRFLEKPGFSSWMSLIGVSFSFICSDELIFDPVSGIPEAYMIVREQALNNLIILTEDIAYPLKLSTHSSS